MRLNAPTRPDLTKGLLSMANVGGGDNPATWGAEPLRINVVLHRLFPVPWATYCYAKAAREADSDLQQKYIVYDSDADRRLVA